MKQYINEFKKMDNLSLLKRDKLIEIYEKYRLEREKLTFQILSSYSGNVPPLFQQRLDVLLANIKSAETDKINWFAENLKLSRKYFDVVYHCPKEWKDWVNYHFKTASLYFQYINNIKKHYPATDISNINLLRACDNAIHQITETNKLGEKYLNYQTKLRKYGDYKGLHYNSENINIALASENKAKFDATKEAFAFMFPDKKINVFCFAANSKVSEQPINHETYRGAKNRMDDMMENLHRGIYNFDYFVSIENGVFSPTNKRNPYDACVIIIDDGMDRKIIYGKEKVYFPFKYYEDSLSFNKNITVGHLIEQDLHLDKGHWHEYFDYHKRSRSQIIFQELLCFTEEDEKDDINDETYYPNSYK